MRYWGLALTSLFVSGVAAHSGPYKHVFFVSIDGFHGSDVQHYVSKRPRSTIARLLDTGYEYTNAYTSAPSDSFPGTMNQMTGASPVHTGIWYDDTYDRTFYPPGSNCTGPAGAEGEFVFLQTWFTRLKSNSGIRRELRLQLHPAFLRWHRR
jgi:Type I phosphodiesterase / nucleotide pyrophosphatase